jgi:hypothetical protein
LHERAVELIWHLEGSQPCDKVRNTVELHIIKLKNQPSDSLYTREAQLLVYRVDVIDKVFNRVLYKGKNVLGLEEFGTVRHRKSHLLLHHHIVGFCEEEGKAGEEVRSLVGE